MFQRLALPLSVLTAALALAAAPGEVSAQTPADAVAAQLGDRLLTRSVPADGTDVRWGEATLVMDVPTSTVLRIVTDYANYSEFMPHFTQSRELSRRGNSALVYLQASVLQGTASLWAQMRMREQRPRGETRIFEGSMTEGNMRKFAARWEVSPVDGGTRTLVRFRLLVAPDLPFPSSLFTEQNVKASRKALRALEARASEPRFAVARRD